MPKRTATRKKSSSRKNSQNTSLTQYLWNTSLGIVFSTMTIFLIYATVTRIIPSHIEPKTSDSFWCNEEKTRCEQSQSMLATLTVQVCGESIVFYDDAVEKESLLSPSDKNILHWNAVVQVDPDTRQPIDYTPLYISAFFDKKEYSFPESCPDNPLPTLTVRINGFEMETGLETPWHDGDTIDIVYK